MPNEIFHCIVFLSKTLYFDSASFLFILIVTLYKWVVVNLMLAFNPAMDYHHIQGGAELLLVDSYYINWDILQPDGPIGSNADITLYLIEYTAYVISITGKSDDLQED